MLAVQAAAHLLSSAAMLLVAFPAAKSACYKLRFLLQSLRAWQLVLEAVVGSPCQAQTSRSEKAAVWLLICKALTRLSELQEAGTRLLAGTGERALSLPKFPSADPSLQEEIKGVT